MIWVTLLKTLLSLASGIAKIVNDRGLMEAGAAKAVLEGLEDAKRQTKLAVAAGDAAAADGVSDPFSED